MKRRLLIVGFVLAVVAGSIWAWTSYERSMTKMVKTSADLGVDLSADAVTLTQGEEGQARWRLVAKSARYDNSKGLVELTNPEVRYYTGQDRAELFVRAPMGEVDRSSDSATLWPEVSASYGEMSLHADKMTYLGKKKTIEMSGNVEMRRAGMELNAETVVVDVTTKDIVAMRGVSAVLPPQSLSFPAGQGAPTANGERS